VVGRSLPARPVLKYYLFMATNTAALSVPIWVVFLRSRGLSFTEIVVLDAIWWLGIIGGEVPTGYLADRIGWRESLLAGNLVRTVGVVAMGLSNTFPALVGVYLLWALGSTMQSGSADAWLYEVLDERIGTEAFTRVRGRGNALTLLVGALASVTGGYVAAQGLRLPFYVNGALWLVGTAVLATFPAVTVDPGDRVSPAEALPLLRERLLSGDLRRFVLWVGVVLGGAQGVARLTQPVSVDLGIPIAGLGWLYALFTVLAAVASARAEWIRDRIGVDGWFLLAPAVLGTLFVGAWAVPLVALPGFVALRAVKATTTPLANGYVNDRIGTAGRATVLSGVSMVYSLVKIPFSLLGGALADASAPLVAIGALGALLLAATALVHRRGSPIATDEPGATPAD